VVYRFDSYELDASEYRLSRDQTAIRVKPKVLELLAYLIERRDRVVAKEELLSTLWQGRYVSEGVLAEAIHEARRALGDEAGKGLYIRTVHGRGYQFVFRAVQAVGGGGEPSGAGAFFYCLDWTGGPTPLQPGENFIGRDSACLIVLAGPQVSRRHARVDVSSSCDVATVHDLGSKNGTAVNGERITSPRTLVDGDVIEVGGLDLTLRERRRDVSTLTSTGKSGP
jgi:DNA-binding winged helix-turn-helix (wHTH) protein